MDIGSITLLLFGSLFFLLAIGVPAAFAMGGVTIFFSYILWGLAALYIIPTQLYGAVTNPILMAIPLFLLMALTLQFSGIADDLFEAIYHWVGSLKGGLAMGTVVICVIFAAMSGITGAATITMGLIALPAMLKRNYDKSIAMGSIMAGGGLGIVIPPSVPMILFALITRQSVGSMFFGGIVPGIMAATLFISYIGIRSALQPDLCPAVPASEKISLKEKVVLLKSIILPAGLIFTVLGSIYTGAATPTEAAAVGALGAFVCTAIHGRLKWKMIREATHRTFRLTGMVMWIVGTAAAFNALYIGLGAQRLIIDIITGLEVSPWFIILGMHLILFVLGMVIDDYAIIMLCAPIFTPIVIALGFDPLWFGVTFILNIKVAYITPPFGFNLFYMKGVVPEGITMADIYRSSIAFVVLQLVAVTIAVLFPWIVTWLPNLMMQ